MNLCALIMAGGHGTRFWPWSNELLPKQFLPLAHPEQTLLQQTFARIAALTGVDRVMVLTNHEYVAVVRTQLPELPPSAVVGEPLLRDTAAAIALGTSLAAARWPGAVQIVLPADHEIAPDSRFREVLGYAARCADADGMLYTVGLKPSRPTTVYGYLQRGAILESDPGFVRSGVAAFVEKPDAATAKRYVDSGQFYWNGGMFIWRPDAIADAVSRHLPQHATLLPPVVATRGLAGFDDRLREVFLKLPKISIDYGVMQAEGEQGRVRVVEGDFYWSDLGGWTAFGDKLDPDGNGNRVFGHALDWDGESWAERWQPREPRHDDKDEDLSLGEVFTFKAHDNLVFNNRRGHRVTLFGVNDLAVVHTHTDTLVAPRSLVESLKDLVSRMPQPQRRGGMVTPHRVNKPWGWELWWGWTKDFAGKTLFLEKGKRLSLQYHVVKEEVIYLHQGRAILETAPRGEPLTRVTLEPGQALHVEPGRLHRLEAIEDCLLFESSLPFLWDVVRVADDFGREGTRAAEAPGSGPRTP